MHKILLLYSKLKLYFIMLYTFVVIPNSFFSGNCLTKLIKLPCLMSVAKFTREACTCVLLGRPKDLCATLLPTYKDILLCCNFERLRLGKLSKSNKEPAFSTIAQVVAKKVSNIYSDASIPQVSSFRVLQLIDNIHQKYRNIKKIIANKRKSDQRKVDDFVSSLNRLFDISSCKCLDMTNCKCSKERQIPENVRKFLFDQRNERKLRISSKFCNNDDIEKDDLQLPNSNQSSQSSSNPNSLELGQNDSQGFMIPETFEKKHKTRLSETVIVGQRFGLSDRAIAAVSSAVLVDHGLATENDSTLIVDRSKVRRSKRKVNEEIQSRQDETFIRALYFDGRKDDTIAQVKQGAKYRRISIKEEHVSILSEPESVYVGHIVPETSSAEHISSGILNFVSDKGGSEDLVLVGCDGTVVNTGYKGGVIRLIEKKIGRPVQWSICLLHFNELPFRALFHHIDGRTEGPNSFTGPIGKHLKSCETLPVACFEKIDFTVPNVDIEDLSPDQKYLLKISKAIQAGECPEDLSLSQPGCLNHARWLTCANRILRLYVSTSNPSAELKIIVTYLLKVYVPQWFSIRKKNPLWKAHDIYLKQSA